MSETRSIVYAEHDVIVDALRKGDINPNHKAIDELSMNESIPCTALGALISSGECPEDLVMELIGREDLKTEGLLVRICKHGTDEMLQRLLSHKNLETNRYEGGVTELHMFAAHGSKMGVIGEVVDCLWSLAEEADENGNTALHVACCRPSPSMITALVSHCPPEKANKDGKTPLMILATRVSSEEKALCIGILLSSCPDTDLSRVMIRKSRHSVLSYLACDDQDNACLCFVLRAAERQGKKTYYGNNAGITPLLKAIGSGAEDNTFLILASTLWDDDVKVVRDMIKIRFPHASKRMEAVLKSIGRE